MIFSKWFCLWMKNRVLWEVTSQGDLNINSELHRWWWMVTLQSYSFFFWYIYRLCYYSCPISAPSFKSILPSPSLPCSPRYSSCPWVIHISSLASTFPILFLPFIICSNNFSIFLFSTYHLCYLFSVLFSSLSPSHSPVDNPSCDLHFCGSVPVLVVYFCLLYTSDAADDIGQV